MYASRAVRLPGKSRSYLYAAGPWPEIGLLFHPNRLIHDHAWWIVKLRLKYQRWPWWKLWPVEPPAYALRFIDVGPVDRAIGWLLTLAAVWRAL